jgi:hypothetical protein
MHGTTIKKYSQDLKIVTLQGFHVVALHNAFCEKLQLSYLVQ